MGFLIGTLILLPALLLAGAIGTSLSSSEEDSEPQLDERAIDNIRSGAEDEMRSASQTYLDKVHDISGR